MYRMRVEGFVECCLIVFWNLVVARMCRGEKGFQFVPNFSFSMANMLYHLFCLYHVRMYVSCTFKYKKINNNKSNLNKIVINMVN